MKRIIYLIIGWIAVACALVGTILPIVPTVPFLLVAAWAFGQSSEELRQKLLSHPVFGPDIRRWQERGAIRRPAKILAVVAMAGSVVITAALDAPVYALVLQAAVLTMVSVFIVSRPES